MRVRLARTSDAAAVSELASTLGYPTDRKGLRGRLERLRLSTEQAVFVAESSAGVIGWVHVFAAQRLASEPFAELGGLVVAPEHQRQGVGSRLVAAAEAWARDQGIASLRVRSRVERQGAHAFYQGLGFEHGKSQAVYVRRLDD